MILFYTEQLPSRLRYVARLLCTDLLGHKLRFTDDKQEYLSSTLPKINYSRDPLQSGIFIQAASLLFETDIFQQELKVGRYKEALVFFLTGKQSHLPFDPFAAAFYLVSRYEEYIPFIADEHNRFPAEASLMHKHQCLHLPLVNIYAEMLGEILLQANVNMELRKPSYRFINSVDIDNAAAYLGKGLIRVLAGYTKDIVSLNFSEVAARSRVLLQQKNDPFETYGYLQKLQKKYQFKTVFFALFSRMGQYDRSLTRFSSRLQRYVKGISDENEVGIHPSYRSNDDLTILEEELTSLQRVLKKDVVKSRQHFLKLSFPKTYRDLLNLEITDDYSMGYANVAGFRAGICTPFRFYDLEQEIETPLVVHPFPFMDGTFIYYLKLKPQQAWPVIKNYINTYRRYGGEFIPIWHNRIYSEKEPEWQGWNAIFEKMVQEAV
jgi:hypothetical protein